MSNNEIHNYINEQTTPTDGDFMDLDADQGGGSYLSKKMTLSNLRKWLFKLVSQEVSYSNIVLGNTEVLDTSNYNVFVLEMNGGDQEIQYNLPPFQKNATYLVHIHNNNGVNVTLNTNFITTPDNPAITTTAGGYAQVWITYHKKADNTEIWTANTINFI